MNRIFLAPLMLAALALPLAAQQAQAAPAHGIAMHGQPALPANYANFPYADPKAPKGGTITYGVVGAFDSVNPLIVKSASTTARGILDTVFGNLVLETLMSRSADEAFTLYGLLAETIDTPDDRSSVTFTLNPTARFSDGQAVTVEDVIFTMKLLGEKGRPNYKTWTDKIAKAEQIGERAVKFTFKDGGDRELPLLIAGSIPIVPKHAVDEATFDQSTLKPMVGSGPYVISEVSAPSRIVFKRNPNYWGKDIPAKRGFDNFDTVIVDYYRDTNILFEAFKKGLFDVYPEGDPASWDGAYNFPAVTDGRVVKEEFGSGAPKAMMGFVFNTRRPVFADVRVRKALAMLFDFEWVNRNLYHDIYSRTGSYFQDSDLTALGRPASVNERKLLAAFSGVVAPEVIEGTYRPQKSDGSGNDRAVLRAASDLVTASGYRLEGTKLLGKDGKPLEFEFLVTDREAERLALTYARQLERLGLVMNVRTVDSTQYFRRLQTFDFDMMQTTIGSSLSPGNEQLFRWSMDSATTDGSFNYSGAKEKAIDAMVDAMLVARGQDEFVDAVRALDRVLISGHYVVPLFFLPKQWIARWTKVRHPSVTSLTGYKLATWWAAP